MEYKIVKWWEGLTEREREMFITFLYNQDLRDYGFEFDKETEEYKEIK